MTGSESDAYTAALRHCRGEGTAYALGWLQQAIRSGAPLVEVRAISRAIDDLIDEGVLDQPVVGS